MGANAEGDKIKLDVKLIQPLLQDESLSISDKIRLVNVYILQNGGRCSIDLFSNYNSIFILEEVKC